MNCEQFYRHNTQRWSTKLFSEFILTDTLIFMVIFITDYLKQTTF